VQKPVILGTGTWSEKPWYTFCYIIPSGRKSISGVYN